MRFISRAKTMAKTTMTALYRVMPSSTPMPTPVRAEWPRASEKKAMPLLTTMVPRRANRGMMSSTANRALRIKSYCHQLKSASISFLDSLIRLPPGRAAVFLYSQLG